MLAGWLLSPTLAWPEFVNPAAEEPNRESPHPPNCLGWGGAAPRWLQDADSSKRAAFGATFTLSSGVFGLLSGRVASMLVPYLAYGPGSGASWLRIAFTLQKSSSGQMRLRHLRSRKLTLVPVAPYTGGAKSMDNRPNRDPGCDAALPEPGIPLKAALFSTKATRGTLE